jgi:hypothetical protein
LSELKLLTRPERKPTNVCGSLATDAALKVEEGKTVLSGVKKRTTKTITVRNAIANLRFRVKLLLL